jgi:hypothetical protein
MLQYILATTFFFCIVIFVYIKIKYPFWNIQPIFHTYDYWRYYYRIPFIIHKYRPVKNKFCDFVNVNTKNLIDCTEEDMRDITNLLQCYYVSSDRIIHLINENNIRTILTGIGEPSYVSIFYEKLLHKPNALEDIVSLRRPIGCITSRAFKMNYRPTLSESMYSELPLYYIDYLCVQREQDTRRITRNLYQTHEYNQRTMNPNISVSLLKKEIDLFEGVVPFISYNSDTYYLRKNKLPILPSTFQVLPINEKNIDIITDFLDIQTHLRFDNQPCLFDICITQHSGYYLSLINDKQLHIYCLKSEGQVFGLYFFKDTKTQYEDIEGNTLQLVGSVMNSTDDTLFYTGFLHSLDMINKTNRYKMFILESISHNQIIFNHWRTNYNPIFTNKTAYYLYNYVYPSSPLPPEKCLLLLI